MNKNKTKIYLFIIIVIGVILSVFFIMNSKNNELKKENKSLRTEQQKNKNQSQNDKIDDKSEDTFEEDAKWLVKSIYEIYDRTELYQEINESLSEKVSEQIFGDDFDPNGKKNVEEQPEMEREIKNENFYGKYIDDDKYSIILTFDYDLIITDTPEKHYVVVEMEFEKDDNDDWIVTKLEELSIENR